MYEYLMTIQFKTTFKIKSKIRSILVKAIP